MDGAGNRELSAALDRLWVQFLPQMKERLALLESANQALAAGHLPEELRADANAAAHKLAGVLGTFGLTKGTVLAREAEVIYSSDIGTDKHAVSRLQSLVRQLRDVISNRG